MGLASYFAFNVGENRQQRRMVLILTIITIAMKFKANSIRKPSWPHHALRLGANIYMEIAIHFLPGRDKNRNERCVIIILTMILTTIAVKFKASFIDGLPWAGLALRHSAKVYGYSKTFAC